VTGAAADQAEQKCKQKRKDEAICQDNPREPELAVDQSGQHIPSPLPSTPRAPRSGKGIQILVRDGVVGKNPVTCKDVKSGASVLEQGRRARLLHEDEKKREEEGDVSDRGQ
jgi:hypothetical protein